MRIIRSIITGLFFFLYALFALPFAIFLPFLPRNFGRLCVRNFYHIFIALIALSRLFSIKTYLTTPPRARIVVMNHISLIDICILFANIPDAVCIAKAGIKKNPVLSLFVRRLFISNDKGGEETLREAANYLKSGINVVIFPQGTRGGKTYHRGAARLSLLTRVPISLFKIYYEKTILAKHQPWWELHEKCFTVSLTQLGEIAPSTSNTRANAIKLTEEIRARLTSMVSE